MNITNLKSKIDFEGPKGPYTILDIDSKSTLRYEHAFKLVIKGLVAKPDNDKFEKSLLDTWVKFRSGMCYIFIDSVY